MTVSNPDVSALPVCFANAGLDRTGIWRQDKQALTRMARDPASKTLSLNGDRVLLDQHHHRLLWRKSMECDLSDILFLGKNSDNTPLFAIEIADSKAPFEGSFRNLREAAPLLSALEAHASATARTLFYWHRQNPYCARCGQKSQIDHAGWRRICLTCDCVLFPRTDPVAIMLAVHEDRCLLAHRPVWPEGRYSCLAGFIEPGESIEDGAAREMAEEAGVQWSGKSRYLCSQPWPFPACLMIGLEMEVTATEITLDCEELADARWFERAEMRRIIDGKHPHLSVPEAQTVSHQMIRQWAFGESS